MSFPKRANRRTTGGHPTRPRSEAAVARRAAQAERATPDGSKRPTLSPSDGKRTPAIGSGAPALVSDKPVKRSGRRRSAMLLLLLILALLVAEVAVFKPFQGAQYPAARLPAPLPLADIDPVGANLFMHKEVDNFKKDKTMALVHDAGIAWIKQQFPWPEIEIRGPGDYYDYRNGKSSWLKFDDIVDRATRNGMRIIARLDRAPTWARLENSPDSAPPRDPQLFANFVTAFVQRYQGRVQAVQIWNEPNLQDEWNGPSQPVDAAGYAALLKAAYLAAKKVDPNIIVLSAPLAITNEEGGNLRETLYLDRMYQALENTYNPNDQNDCRHCLDVLSANGFGLDRAPEDPPSAEVLNFRRVELLRGVMESRGDSAKPIWFTEYGWNSSPETLTQEQQDRWRRVSQVEQSDYTVRGIQYAREHWPWAGVFTIWYFRQVGDIPPWNAEYYFSMVTPEFVPEPIYYAVQNLSASLQTAGVGNHGVLSGPVTSNGDWRLNLNSDGAEGGSTPLLIATAPTSTITLRFEGTDVDIDLREVGLTAEGAPARLYVTVDGGVSSVAQELPRDEAGRPYLDAATLAAHEDAGKLAAPSAQANALTLVRKLGSAYAPAVHELELRSDGTGASIAGFTVRSERSLTQFYIVTAILLVALVADVALMRRWRAG